MKKTEELVEDFLSDLKIYSTVTSEQVPDIGLYMDQVTSFMENSLAMGKRYPDDKVLTKAMINNYAKNHLLPPPDKKKYSRDHILILLFIYYYKNLLSFRDIEQLLKPLTRDYFRTNGDVTLSEIFDKLFTIDDEQAATLKADIRKKIETAGTVFEENDTDDSEYLKMFAFISELFSDIYIKKKLMEYLIDRLSEENGKNDTVKKKK